MAWTCPKCERKFAKNNQSHYCNETDLDALFAGKPEELLLTFDQLLIAVYDWPEVGVGTGKKAIVFSVGKAFLIVRPMSKQLDLKFYHTDKFEDRLFFKRATWGKKFAYHMRVSKPEDLTPALIQWIKKGYDFAMS